MTFDLALVDLKTGSKFTRTAWETYEYVYIESGAVGSYSATDYFEKKSASGFSEWKSTSSDLLASDWTEV